MYYLKNNGKVIAAFIYPLEKVVQLSNLIIVQLEIPSAIIFNENIYCVSKSGDFIWQIERTRLISENSPYINIYSENGKLFAINYDSWTEEINIHTGSIINSKFSK